ncbi:MAG: PadR family transcriptional regulator [Thermoplasmatota archaeon]
MSDAGSKVMRGLLEVFLLESLESSPKHGYALLKEMEERFGVEPNRNKLYPLLARLEEDGLVEGGQDDTTGRQKIAYVLTPRGREELEEYRRLPQAFRASVERVWFGGKSQPATALPPTTPTEPQASSSTAPPAAPSASTPTPAVGASPIGAAPANAPYPCRDARVGLTKNPVTGELEVRLTGCPMGAYVYCPQCPVFQAVDGLRRFTFG